MEPLFKNKYRIESARLQGWDYTAAGWYFVTICTQNRECFLGEVVAGEMQLSPIGETASQYWKDIPQHSSKNIGIDVFVIMPNHVHGIVVIDPCRDVACNVSTK
jgi:REP element-mobilizing transposase RayT